MASGTAVTTRIANALTRYNRRHLSKNFFHLYESSFSPSAPRSRLFSSINGTKTEENGLRSPNEQDIDFLSSILASHPGSVISENPDLEKYNYDWTVSGNALS